MIQSIRKRATTLNFNESAQRERVAPERRSRSQISLRSLKAKHHRRFTVQRGGIEKLRLARILLANQPDVREMTAPPLPPRSGQFGF